MRTLLLAVCASLAARAAAEPPPNIVVIDICSARADRFGPHDGKPSLTPSLDKFAQESATFERAWAQSSWCLPNYATLLTGHRPEVHGLYANEPFRGLADWEQTLAERMRATGYRTGGFTAGVYTLPAWGLDRGFDTYVNHFSTAEILPGRFADMAPEIESWVARSSTQPFFLFATVDDLHAPYQTDESTGDAAVPAEAREEYSMRFYRAYNGERVEPALRARAAAFKKDPQALPRLRARYDSAVRSVDRSIADFLEDLKRRGLWDNTVVVVTADHGELLGEHGLLGHTEGLYEPVLHVPMIVRDPRYPRSRGARIGALVERIDLPPTLLERAGASTDGLELQGRSLLPLLADPTAPWRDVSYASSKRNLADPSDWTIDERAIRDGRWKLIWPLYKGRWELYDLAADPGETRDLAAARPDIVARLAFRLESETESARTHAQGRPSGKTEPAADLVPARRD